MIRPKAYHVKRFIGTAILFLFSWAIFVSYQHLNSISLISAENGAARSYLINTTNCKIPELDPFNDDVKPYLFKEEYRPCSDKPLLTYIDKMGGVVKLKVNQSVIHLYSFFGLECCYSYVRRVKGVDSEVLFDTCKTFYEEIILSYPFVKVTCRNVFGVAYENVHAAIIPDPSTLETDPKKWNVFLLGIDSVSRQNLQRTMPKVHSFLENNFIGFNGYNKIEDNTFPNLIAVLSGRSLQTLRPLCDKYENFDNCDIIWKSFEKSGYVTAYGEDETDINTFNLYKTGFAEPPTSIYLRPYLLAAYTLPQVVRHTMAVCTGPENSADRLFNAAKDFLSTFKNSPTFALFWFNSFSHDELNFPATMDDKLLHILTDPLMTESGSVFIIFSDHGFRFGNVRFTYTGSLEERLPFLYFQFPKAFQLAYPRLVENLKYNARNRLTTPYDFHMTLQHLLELSDNEYNMKPSRGCPKCKSLFEVIDENRTCEDAGIPRHWCTCAEYVPASANSEGVLDVAQYVVDQVNGVISGFPKESYKCALYVLDRVVTVRRAGDTDYLVLIRTKPYSMFEATVRKRGATFELLGQISRVNKYERFSECVHKDVLTKYCFCDNWRTKVRAYFSRWTDS